MRATHLVLWTCSVNTRLPAGGTAATILAHALSAPIADSPVIDAAFKIAASRFFTSSGGETHTDRNFFKADDAHAATGPSVAERLRAARADLGPSLKEAVAYENGTVRDIAWSCDDGRGRSMAAILGNPSDARVAPGHKRLARG